MVKEQIIKTSNIENPRKYKSKMITIKKFIPLYVMFIPVLLYYLIFSYAPMTGIIIAFKDYSLIKGVFGSDWAGLKHFERFISNGDFWIVLKNTLILAGLRILIGFPTPILFAILLYELRLPKFKRFIQTISYLPHFISWVVVYGILYNIFSSGGVLNHLLGILGVESSENYLGLERYFRSIFVGSAVWKEIGWSAIIYLAALTSVDTEMFEAAMIDGSNRFQKLWYIVLPSITPIISIMFILSLGGILSVSFEQVLVMFNPAVSTVADVIDYYIYRVGLLQINNYSYATAVGLFRSVLALGIVLLTNWGANKIDQEGAIW